VCGISFLFHFISGEYSLRGWGPPPPPHPLPPPRELLVVMGHLYGFLCLYLVLVSAPEVWVAMGE